MAADSVSLSAEVRRHIVTGADLAAAPPDPLQRSRALSLMLGQLAEPQAWAARRHREPES